MIQFLKISLAILFIGSISHAEVKTCESLFVSAPSDRKPITDLSSFNDAMTRGMLLSPEQADLFEIYRKTSFGDPSTSVSGKTLKDVEALVQLGVSLAT